MRSDIRKVRPSSKLFVEPVSRCRNLLSNALSTLRYDPRARQHARFGALRANVFCRLDALSSTEVLLKSSEGHIELLFGEKVADFSIRVPAPFQRQDFRKQFCNCAIRARGPGRRLGGLLLQERSEISNSFHRRTPCVASQLFRRHSGSIKIPFAIRSNNRLSPIRNGIGYYIQRSIRRTIQLCLRIIFLTHYAPPMPFRGQKLLFSQQTLTVLVANGWSA